MPPTHRQKTWIMISLAGAAVLFTVLAGTVIIGSRKAPEVAKETAAAQKDAGSPLRQEVQQEPGGVKKKEPKSVPGKPVLVICCGKGNGANEQELVHDNFGCTLIQGKPYEKANPGDPNVNFHCWFDKETIKFDVTLPPGVAGTLRLHFWDFEKTGRKQKLIVQDKDIGNYENFDGAGVYPEVTVAAADSPTGKIAVAVRKLPGSKGHNVVVSRVEFVPNKDPAGRETSANKQPDDSPNAVLVPGKPALTIRCGKDNGKQEEETVVKGYDYRLCQGTPWQSAKPDDGNNRSHCWFDDKEVQFEVIVPPGTSGKLLLCFLKTGKAGHKQKLMVAGKDIGDTDNVAAPGKTTAVPISAGDTQGGVIAVTLKNLAKTDPRTADPKMCAGISGVEFMPSRE